MSPLRFLIAAAGAVAFLLILRKAVRYWLGGPRREELYREMELEERSYERGSGEESPECPLCGSHTRLHTYPHIKVWRCNRYPECRGYVKARKAKRMKFAEDWDRKRRRGGGAEGR